MLQKYKSVGPLKFDSGAIVSTKKQLLTTALKLNVYYIFLYTKFEQRLVLLLFLKPIEYAECKSYSYWYCDFDFAQKSYSK